MKTNQLVNSWFSPCWMALAFVSLGLTAPLRSQTVDPNYPAAGPYVYALAVQTNGETWVGDPSIPLVGGPGSNSG